MRAKPIFNDGTAGLLCGAAVLLTANAASCPVRNRGSTAILTHSLMYHVQEAVSEFASIRGRLPDSLNEICSERAACAELPGSSVEGLRDGWGRPFSYTRDSSEYELRSNGPDGRADTADDITFRPSTERSRMQNAAGCYSVDLSWWNEFQGARLVLDTVMQVPGLFVLRPQLSNEYMTATWWLWGDTVTLDWSMIHSVARISVQVMDDSLIGAASIPGYRRKKVVAYRTVCSN